MMKIGEQKLYKNKYNSKNKSVKVLNAPGKINRATKGFAETGAWLNSADLLSKTYIRGLDKQKNIKNKFTGREDFEK